MVKLKNYLYISAHIPDKNATEAGHRIAYDNLTTLLKNNKNVFFYLIFFTNNQYKIRKPTDFNSKNLKVFVIKISFLKKIFNWLCNLKIPPKFAFRFSKTTLNLINKLVENHNIEKIYYDFEESAIYSLYLTRSSIKSYLFTYDVVTQWWLRAGGVKGLFASITYSFERKILNKVNLTYVYSSKDKQLINNLFGIYNVNYIKPKLSDFIYSVRRNKTTIEENSILFWGAMNRIENENAILYFVKTIYPALLNAVPELKLYIVGSNPSFKITRLAKHNIIVTGYVKNPTHYFEICEFGIAPLNFGAGIKLKVLEMLEVDMKVFSSPVGAEGIPKTKKLILCRNREEFISKITHHLKRNLTI